MKAAAKILKGQHDFRAFTALNGPPKENSVRDLRKLDFVQRGRKIRIVAEADGFMYKMMRSLVGAIVAVGEGKLSLEELKDCLRTGARVAAVQTAPAQGLFLEKVFY
jgi:tRNA pseudouridine38-40 synthase